MSDSPTPVVFVHGLWLHATSWGPWMDLFGDAGYATSAPCWPGESESIDEARKQPEAVAGQGISDIVDHYAAAIAELPTKPIVIGHSFGGLLAQLLLDRGLASAAVALDPAPIKGVLYLPPTALRVASIALRNPSNRSRALALSKERFRYGFGNAISEDESNELFEQWTIPSPMRPLFEAAASAVNPNSPAKVNTKNTDRGPLLLVGGGSDRTAPAVITRQSLRLYKKSSAVTHYKEFPDRGHSLTLDSGWREIAEASLAWLRGQGL